MEYLVLFIIAAVTFIILSVSAVAFLAKKAGSNTVPLIFRVLSTIILLLICIPLLWLALTACEPEVVLFQAKRIAGNRPYCIVVYDKDRNLPSYKAAANRNDFTFSALVTNLSWGGSGYGNGMAETYYSLLILKNPDEMRNWSKLYLNFENDVEPTQESVYRTDFSKICTPAVDFANSIRW